MKKFSEKINGLVDEIQKESRNPKAPTEKKLNELYKLAKKEKDDDLFGFVYFHFADYYYFMKPDKAKFDKYLMLAVEHLLNGEDRSLLGDTYNLFAVDAHNGGNHIIAFQYYLTALRIGKEAKKRMLCAATDANIGRLLMEVGDNKLADEYLREGVELVQKGKNDSTHIRYIITITYLYAINCVALKKRKEARECLKIIDKRLKESSDSVVKSFRLPYLFLSAQLAASGKKQSSLEEIVGEMVPLMKREAALFDYMEDIYYLSNLMIEKGYIKQVGKILDACKPKISDIGITHVEKQYYELKLAYDEAAGHPNKALEDMERFNACMEKEEREQYEYSIKAIEISNLMTKMRQKNRETKYENRLLKVEADTDTLTGLPNRYAMNDYLDSAFDKAYAQKKPLGIGIMDIDYFKEYNDTYGHHAGDVCLNAIAGVLKRVSKEIGVFCARYGGDEFVVVMEEASKKKIEAVAMRINEDLMSCNITHQGSPLSGTVTLTQGYVTAIPKGNVKIWDYLSEADKLLYAEKKARSKARKERKVPVIELPQGESD